jgi:diadenosine tetraphosphate (Ap4A) HIT family hydrolase
MNQECLFCSISDERVIAFNEYVFAIRDGYPVADGHTLIIPHRHAVDFFGLTSDESEGARLLIHEIAKNLKDGDDSITAFNIGLNAGVDAGQTILHCHYHLIPRRKGDVENPRGGIRHLIPGKGCY